MAVGLLLTSLLAAGTFAGAEADALAPFDRSLAAAESSLQGGDFAAAERHYKDALFEGWMVLGTLHRLDRRRPEAVKAFAEASRLDPEDRRASQSLAAASLQRGETLRAAEILASLAAKDPGDFETRRLLARALAAEGKTDQAARTLDEARAAVAGDPESEFLLATEYLWLKKADAAEGLFAKLLQARPQPQTRVLIGRTYRDAGEYDRARAQLRAALEQDPHVRRAHYYLGMVSLADARTGPERLDRAIAEFQAELALDPQDPPANDQLGTALLEAGRPAEALPALEAAVRAEARSSYVHHLGRCQLALDRPAEAAASLKRALALAGDEAAGEAEIQKIHYQLGLALRKAGATQEAASHLAEAGRLTSGNEASNDEVAPVMESSPLAELPRGEREQITQRVKAGLARAYSNLGVMQAQGGRFPEAAELFEQALALDPDFPRLQYSLGVAYFNAKQYDKAIGPLSRALAGEPQDPGVKRMLALAWLNRGEYAKAAELLQDDPQLGVDPSLQFAYGLALVKSDRAAEALVPLQAAVRRAPEDPNVRYLLGEAYQKLGRAEEAQREFERFRQLKDKGRKGGP